MELSYIYIFFGVATISLLSITAYYYYNLKVLKVIGTIAVDEMLYEADKSLLDTRAIIYSLFIALGFTLVGLLLYALRKELRRCPFTFLLHAAIGVLCVLIMIEMALITKEVNSRYGIFEVWFKDYIEYSETFYGLIYAGAGMGLLFSMYYFYEVNKSYFEMTGSFF